jgi:hypothetical protein
LLAEGIRRLRFRDGYPPADTSNGIPGTAYEVVINLPDIANTFITGHKIRVDITSSNYPRFDCNLNNGLALYTAGDSLIATNNIYLNSIHASYIQLPLIDYAGAINEPDAKDDLFNVYPDPAANSLYIDTRGASCKDFIFSLIDITGRVVGNYFMEKNSHHMEIDVSRLDPGIYFIRSATEIKRFIKI